MLSIYTYGEGREMNAMVMFFILELISFLREENQVWDISLSCYYVQKDGFYS